jgi:ubiquitin-like protein ATG12
MEQDAPYKVIIRLKATGSAPILKQQVFKLSSKNPFGKVVQFIRKELGLQNESLYCYINSSFMPTMDDLLGDLDGLFGIDQTGIIVNYSLQPAYG